MRLIELTKNKWAQVDDQDFDYINRFEWYAIEITGIWYARRSVYFPDTKKRSTISMHRDILKVTGSSVHVDHIDHNGLNNTRINLRACTNRENQHNRKARKNLSGYKGVTKNKGKKPWRARIVVNSKEIQLGEFDDVIEAAICYDNAAKLYFGNFANLNFN